MSSDSRWLGYDEQTVIWASFHYFYVSPTYGKMEVWMLLTFLHDRSNDELRGDSRWSSFVFFSVAMGNDVAEYRPWSHHHSKLFRKTRRYFGLFYIDWFRWKNHHITGTSQAEVYACTTRLLYDILQTSDSPSLCGIVCLFVFGFSATSQEWFPHRDYPGKVFKLVLRLALFHDNVFVCIASICIRRIDLCLRVLNAALLPAFCRMQNAALFLLNSARPPSCGLPYTNLTSTKWRSRAF